MFEFKLEAMAIIKNRYKKTNVYTTFILRNFSWYVKTWSPQCTFPILQTKKLTILSLFTNKEFI